MQVGDHLSSPDKKYRCVQLQFGLRATHSLPTVSLLGSVSKILYRLLLTRVRTLTGSPAASPARRASQKP